jgi:hypothetical protein
VSDPRPIGVFDSGVGGLTVLREILPPLASRVHDLPGGQPPRALWRPPGRRGPGLLDRGARRAGRPRRQGDRRGLQHLDGRGARRLPAPLRPADPRRRSARSRDRALTTRTAVSG